MDGDVQSAVNFSRKEGKERYRNDGKENFSQF
jgi:hypothetical protein